MKIEFMDQTAQPTLYVRLVTSAEGLTEMFDKNFEVSGAHYDFYVSDPIPRQKMS